MSEIIEIQFPFGGINKYWSYTKQPNLTTPIIINCRAKDSAEQKERGGQRPGKSVTTGSIFTTNRPILRILQIGTTYISPD